jgi:hypothetical protein
MDSWIYLALTPFIIGACLLSLTEERLYIILIAASGLVHEGGLFLLVASAEYRYSHYMIYTSVLALLLLARTYLIGPLRDRKFAIGSLTSAGKPYDSLRREWVAATKCSHSEQQPTSLRPVTTLVEGHQD